MDKKGVGRDIWTSLQNARLDHMPLLPPSLTTGSRLRPDALRLPNSRLNKKQGRGISQAILA